MINEDLINDLIKTKAKSKFNGKITLFFKAGEIQFIEKIQNMNDTRVAREIKRDKNYLSKEVTNGP